MQVCASLASYNLLCSEAQVTVYMYICASFIGYTMYNVHKHVHLVVLYNFYTSIHSIHIQCTVCTCDHLCHLQAKLNIKDNIKDHTLLINFSNNYDGNVIY